MISPVSLPALSTAAPRTQAATGRRRPQAEAESETGAPAQNPLAVPGGEPAPGKKLPRGSLLNLSV
ncbi:Translation initiation factor 2B delta subunit [Rhodovastum atsumiense]|uniref:Uncharacterized protein n=1 Tax=Rhodovastum atsumiense TaxID=504468 RepID=A0A5M6IRT5_9PROT|nr:hypothetical protein [Rhodovastum atsumiense]KAA5610996.1 hypothetical protein F1189_16425 [Rhodovastum atsumiense]CAH2600223.1 Translation initiation factor 2B delta subunit [Rhodovastum atsumiense]